MRSFRKLAILGAAVTTFSMSGAGIANADQYIDFGTNQAACQSAAQQANATGNRGSFCYETGPGHYSLDLASRRSY